MKHHIEQFGTYLMQGYMSGQDAHLESLDQFETVLLVGMGGSGMSLTIMQQLLETSPKSVPVKVVKEYTIPKRVNHNTLMIVASYSGNTEETISAMQMGVTQGAQMIAISSGGILQEYAHQHNQILVPMKKGIEPRAALPIALGVQCALFEKLGFITNVHDTITQVQEWIASKTEQVLEQTKSIAGHIAHSIPIVYGSQQYHALTLRARQQLNENSRMLCWDHQLPEHNHNELLGWQEGNQHCCALWLIDPNDDPRILKRIQLTKQVLDERKVPQYDILLTGGSFLENTLQGIYVVDWLSYRTAGERNVDPSGMELIERLKGEMKK